ncbi:MAG: hypothetical protein ACE5G3_10980 [Gammaproteobacteria bacterium]
MGDTEQRGHGQQNAAASAAGVRLPETLVEVLIANFRPQPAIPALLVLLLTVVFAMMSHQSVAPGAGESSLAWLIPVGILVSCGLAIAAGFCSLFPQSAWILLAGWSLRLTNQGPLPGYNRYVLFAGMTAAAAMIVAQLWRVRTGKFSPTINVEGRDSDAP